MAKIKKRQLTPNQKARINEIARHFYEAANIIDDPHTRMLVRCKIGARIMCYIDDFVPKGKRICRKPYKVKAITKANKQVTEDK